MDIGKAIAQLQRDLATLQRSSRLTHASIENTAVQVYDGGGSLRGIIGVQADGTTAVNVVNGAAPPQPSDPVVVSVLGGVTAAWDGTFAGGATMPLDWSRVEVHASAVTGFTPDSSTLQGTIETAQGATVVVPTDVPVYVVLVARNTSGTASTPSAQVGPTGPAPVVASDILDGIVTTVKLADDAVTAAKVAVAAIDSTAIQDAAITAAKIGAAAVTTGALASAAVTSGAIADDAITAGKVAADAITAREVAAGSIATAELAAGAVTANEIAANAVTAGKIAANSVTATTIAANAVQTAALAADAVAAGKIAADAVTAREIAASAVTASEIAANTITTSKLAAGAVDATALAADAITGKTITGGTITGTTITGGTLQTATSGQRIVLNESGLNKIRVYNSSGTAIAELSTVGLQVAGTNGAVIWLDPNNTFPNLRFTTIDQSTSAVINISGANALLGMNSGLFTSASQTDWKWRTLFGYSSGTEFWAAERVRDSDTSVRLGGRIFLDNTHATVGFSNSADSTQDALLSFNAGLAQLLQARLEMTPNASSSTALKLNAASGYTGNLAQLQLNGTDKFVIDKDGNVTIAGIGQRTTKRRTSDATPKASTTTVTADTQITFTVDANATYTIEGFLKYSGPGDFQMGWSIPTGALGEWHGIGNGTTVASSSNSNTIQTDVSTSWGYTLRTESTDIAATRTYGGISTNTYGVQVRGTLRVSSTGGTFALTWAQGSSNATGTILYTDSYIRLEKVA